MKILLTCEHVFNGVDPSRFIVLRLFKLRKLFPQVVEFVVVIVKSDSFPPSFGEELKKAIKEKNI